MRVRIIGAGWYGCHIAVTLLKAGHEVTVVESASDVLTGASGNNPARLHQGWHYPRSKLTRAMCQTQGERFLREYGFLTREIPLNIYAVAATDSVVDYGTYRQVLSAELPCTPIEPATVGLRNCEGALLTNERHILVEVAREFFRKRLFDRIAFNRPEGVVRAEDADLTIDCTFCTTDAANIDRFEPCLTFFIQGPVRQAVTIMDGPFPSIYPWNEGSHVLTLTSAKWTPLSKDCRTWADARRMLDEITPRQMDERFKSAMRQMEEFWPAAPGLFTLVSVGGAIRAMPRSAADSRLVEVVEASPGLLRIRPGKIDAIFDAADRVLEIINR